MRTDILAKTGRVVALLAAVAALFALLLVALRPWYLQWGASDRDAVAALPGDEFVQVATQSTRAITIEASAEQVWPWLLQLGQDRGGFYSYEFLEDLVGTDMTNLDHLDPALQSWHVGDKLWMYPPHALAGAGHAVLQRIDPRHALVFGTRQLGTGLEQPTDGTWAFVLAPIDATHTRLLVRGRAAARSSPLLRAYQRLLFEPMHFVMERKMMEGIKARAERRPPTPVADVLEVALFAGCFALFCGAAIRLVRWPRARHWTATIVAAGLAFQLLTFVQPPWIVGLLLLAGLLALFELAGYA